MPTMLETYLTDCSAVVIRIPGVEIPLVNTLLTPGTVEVFKIVHLLNLVTDRLILELPEHVTVRDFVNLSFALRTAILHLTAPLLDALEAVLVDAGVQG